MDCPSHRGADTSTSLDGLVLTAEADSRCPLWVISGHWAKSRRCPLYPQKRTLVECSRMSALCQKRTHARQQKFCHLPCAQRNAPAVLTQFFQLSHMRLSALSQANSPEYRGGRVFTACR